MRAKLCPWDELRPEIQRYLNRGAVSERYWRAFLSSKIHKVASSIPIDVEGVECISISVGAARLYLPPETLILLPDEKRPMEEPLETVLKRLENGS